MSGNDIRWQIGPHSYITATTLDSSVSVGDVKRGLYQRVDCLHAPVDTDEAKVTPIRNSRTEGSSGCTGRSSVGFDACVWIEALSISRSS